MTPSGARSKGALVGEGAEAGCGRGASSFMPQAPLFCHLSGRWGWASRTELPRASQDTSWQVRQPETLLSTPHPTEGEALGEGMLTLKAGLSGDGGAASSRCSESTRATDAPWGPRAGWGRGGARADHSLQHSVHEVRSGLPGWELRRPLNPLSSEGQQEKGPCLPASAGAVSSSAPLRRGLRSALEPRLSLLGPKEHNVSVEEAGLSLVWRGGQSWLLLSEWA